jgi:hypothetical protein
MCSENLCWSPEMTHMNAKIEDRPINAKARTSNVINMMNLPKLLFPTQLLIHVQ